MFFRLHESPLFTDQAATYERLGMRAWSEGIVPWRATSCPLLAEIEATLIEGFARDVGARVTVIDVGAGTGRAGFHLAREFATRGIEATLVLTDVAPGNVEALANQPQLAALAAEGRVRFERFDALKPEASSEPTVLLAHYLFDTLPHRVFRRKGSRTFEGWVEVDEALRWEFREAPLPAGLELPTSGTFLVPVGAMEALEVWRSAFSGPLLVLAADKGVEPRTADEDPLVARHDSTSAGVDFELLRRACPSLTHASPAKPSNVFALHAFASRKSRAFDAAWSAVGATNAVLELVEALQQPPAALKGLFELVERSRFDPDVIAQLSARFLEHDLDEGSARRLVEAVAIAAGRHFLFAQQLDVPFNLGVLAHRCGALQLAVPLYLLSLRESGAHASTLLNLARAQHELHRDDAALESLQALLELDPSHAFALELITAWRRPDQ